MPEEGVTRFTAHHCEAAPNPRLHGDTAAPLLAWRQILSGLELIGRDPARYGGVGYGNVSARLGPFPGARGARPFLISGTGTGGKAQLELGDLCRVSRYDIAHNSVVSEGPIRPSSESMTHGAFYDLAPHVRCVLHVHCRAIWACKRLRLPTSHPRIDYGTPEMAREVGRLARGAGLLDRGVMAMAGHEDGVVAFGRDAAEAGAVLMQTLALALQRTE